MKILVPKYQNNTENALGRLTAELRKAILLGGLSPHVAISESTNIELTRDTRERNLREDTATKRGNKRDRLFVTKLLRATKAPLKVRTYKEEDRELDRHEFLERNKHNEVYYDPYLDQTTVNMGAGFLSPVDPVGEFYLAGVAMNPLFKGAGWLAERGLVKAGSNWARSRIIARKMNKNIEESFLPFISSSEVPLEKGFMYHQTQGVYQGRLQPNVGWLGYEASPGALKVVNGKYTSVRKPHFNNLDKIWWNTNGHNTSAREIYVTPESGESIFKAKNFELNFGTFEKSYRVTDPIDINKVVKFTRDPISGTMVPSMPNKVVNNKMTLLEMFNLK